MQDIRVIERNNYPVFKVDQKERFLKLLLLYHYDAFFTIPMNENGTEQLFGSGTLRLISGENYWGEEFTWTKITQLPSNKMEVIVHE